MFLHILLLIQQSIAKPDSSGCVTSPSLKGLRYEKLLDEQRIIRKLLEGPESDYDWRVRPRGSLDPRDENQPVVIQVNMYLRSVSYLRCWPLISARRGPHPSLALRPKSQSSNPKCDHRREGKGCLRVGSPLTQSSCGVSSRHNADSVSECEPSPRVRFGHLSCLDSSTMRKGSHFAQKKNKTKKKVAGASRRWMT